MSDDKPLTPETAKLLDAMDAKRLQEAAATKLTNEVNAAIIEIAIRGYVIVDHDGRILRVNHAIETMFGYSRDELVGKDVGELVPVAAREEHARHLARYMLDPRIRPMGIGLDAKGRHKSGQEFEINVMLSPITVSIGTYYMAAVDAIRTTLSPPQPVPPVRQKVLLVEDTVDFAAMLTKMMATAGFEADIAPTGEQAIEMLLDPANSYVLALVDILLPGGINGVEVARRVHAAGCTVPMVAVSGDIEEAKKLAEGGLGGVGFIGELSKPLSLGKIMELLDRFGTRKSGGS